MALVILQFALLTVLGWQVLKYWTGSIPIYSLVLLLGGVFMGLWAVSANRPGNFYIRPVPKPSGELIENGPYRVIRHPMYLSLVLVGLGAVLVSMEAVDWISWTALVLVLTAKAILEERALQEPGDLFPDCFILGSASPAPHEPPSTHPARIMPHVLSSDPQQTLVRPPIGP